MGYLGRAKLRLDRVVDLVNDFDGLEDEANDLEEEADKLNAESAVAGPHDGIAKGAKTGPAKRPKAPRPRPVGSPSQSTIAGMKTLSRGLIAEPARREREAAVSNGLRSHLDAGKSDSPAAKLLLLAKELRKQIDKPKDIEKRLLTEAGPFFDETARRRPELVDAYRDHAQVYFRLAVLAPETPDRCAALQQAIDDVKSADKNLDRTEKKNENRTDILDQFTQAYIGEVAKVAAQNYNNADLLGIVTKVAGLKDGDDAAGPQGGETDAKQRLKDAVERLDGCLAELALSRTWPRPSSPLKKPANCRSSEPSIVSGCWPRSMPV